MLFAFPLPGWFPGFSFFEKIGPYFALVIYIIASFTDSLDGHLARKNNLITNFGKFLDPIADKLLVTAALLALAAKNNIYLWAAMVILAREFIVTGIRLVAASEGIVIAAGGMGKLKMVLQTISIVVLLFSNIFDNEFGKIVAVIGNILMAIAVIITIVSGIDYISKNSQLLKKGM
jgi:CDP-diacylglycerol--glycerol-3-phosphate 3-phosphatidyltransferase